MSIIYLAVPFEEKDEVKKLGAKWDNNEKKWYILDNLKSLSPVILNLSSNHRYFEEKNSFNNNF